MSAGSAGNDDDSGYPVAGERWRAEMTAQVAALTGRVAHLERLLAEDAAGRGEHSEGREQARGYVAPADHPPAPPPRPAAAAGPLLPSQPRVAGAAPPRASLEDRLGAQVFNWIGMAALLIGASWALKLAFEHGLIGPVGRVIIGLAAGAGLILWSERFRRKALPAFSYSLKAVGSGVLYLSLWAAFQLYHLLPAAAAFAAMALVTAWIAFMAWSQGAELLAAYALAGGLATPLLLSSGGDHETFLFSYLLVIDAATTLLLRFRPWQRLLPAAFLATVAYFIGWYASFFHRGSVVVWDAQSSETALFAALFFAVFALVSLRVWSVQPVPRGGVLASVLLPLANAAFLALALYSVFQDSGLHSSLAWLMLALAALALGLSRLQATTLGAAMQLAAAVVLLTVAIPLKASGHTLTTAWLAEGLVLYWAATRFQRDAAAGASRAVLRILSAIGFALGLIALAFDRFWRNEAGAGGSFFNADLGTSLVAAAALAGTAWLAAQPAEDEQVRAPFDLSSLILALLGIDLVALLLVLAELASSFNRFTHAAFANPAFATALVGLALFAGVAFAAYRLRGSAGRRELTLLAGGTLIAFNLFMVFTGVREISALWAGTSSSDNSVQRSLAISGFLMLYGAVLLAAGFWRRSAFVRWQALVLLIFTILKVFLYDVSGLSQGYRVASFLGLGALLMAVSLAYQRDWLGLKAAAAVSPDPPPTEPAARP